MRVSLRTDRHPPEWILPVKPLDAGWGRVADIEHPLLILSCVILV